MNETQSQESDISPNTSLPETQLNDATQHSVVRTDSETDRSGVKSNIPRNTIVDEIRALLGQETKVFRSRFLMLFLFFLCSMFNAIQWIQYATISNIISYYYDVNEMAVSWTSMVYMLVYIPLIFPATWLLNRHELRFTMLSASFGTCFGSWVKCGSLSSNLFAVTMVGQIIVAISNVFILGIPSHLAGIWFSDKELSRACSVAVFGNQLGIAIGFIVPPFLVPNSLDRSEITNGLRILFYLISASTTVLFIAVIFLFKNRPPISPSRQAAFKSDERRLDYCSSIATLMRNSNYVLLLITYGMNVGVFYAICTLLNDIVLLYYPDEEEDAGWTGLMIIVSGLFGSIVCGVILDKTHKFKEVAVLVYALSTLGMVIFSVVLHYNNFWVLISVAALLGFFMTGYLPLGFEFAAEMTYPEPEGISSGLLNASGQAFGILFTYCGGSLLGKYNDIACNSFLCLALGIGTALTAFIKSDLRRYRASHLPYNTRNENTVQHT